MPDDPVGYARPPKSGRFKEGKSGNPNGRPRKKQQTLDPLAILTEPVMVMQNGVSQAMQPAEASIRKLLLKAVKDRDIRAVALLLELFEKYEVIAVPAAPPISSGVLTIPNTWDHDEWMAMFNEHGPPPWPGRRSGLVE